MIASSRDSILAATLATPPPAMPAALNLANFMFTGTQISKSSMPNLTTLCSTSPLSLTSTVQLPAELDLAQTVGLPPVFVKPQHLSYLRDFRTQQCPLFAKHKCTQHKPFTCFHWHFPNQRRRKPVRLMDGTFSYSPDVYCDKYDETRGECPSGDMCPYLHRNAGDTERRYHLRYFKTGTCIHDTDPRGHCSRNGAHCAFAHGANDLRVPVYDVREIQEANEFSVNLPASLEKERVLSEDPKWNDMAYVLANYKTEQCKKPPRMCRQGYACPFFHNTKDKRRGPRDFKYRSTPCPNVKSSDEWLDSSICDNGENCQYCHTRTEQQFHPEIYKSTKCNDIVQQRYCPRGPFCAFAHDEAEANFGRNFMTDVEPQLVPTPQQRGVPHTLSDYMPESSPPKGRSASGTSLTSVESGLGSMCRGDSPRLYRHGPHSAPGGPISPILPKLDDLDLSVLEGFDEGAEGDMGSFSPLTVTTSMAGGFNPMNYQSANALDSPGGIPFSAFDARLQRVNSGRSSPASSTYAQSPILLGHSPFSNAGIDLERLHYQAEVERAQAEAIRCRELAKSAQRERDEARQALELVCVRLRDLSSVTERSGRTLTPHELEELQAKLQRHITGQPGEIAMKSLSSSADSLGFSTGYLATVDEASGDVTPQIGQSEVPSLNNSANQADFPRRED